MKIPRDLSAPDLIKILNRHGFLVTRQIGSHIRMTLKHETGDFHITVPNHNPIRVGTLNSILNDVSKHLNLSKEEILKSNCLISDLEEEFFQQVYSERNLHLSK